MPSASTFLQKKWGGDRDGTPGIGEGKAIAYLEKQGYYLTNYWTWLKPTPDHKMTRDELEAISFLIDEWDFGGLHKGSNR